MKIEKKGEIPLYRASNELLFLLTDVIKEIERSYKHTIGVKVIEENIELIKRITKANKASSKELRKRYIEEAEGVTDSIVLLLRALYEKRKISLKHYTKSSEMLENISRQLSGWKKTVN